MQNKYLITSLIFFLITIVGFIIYLNSESPIPVVYATKGSIRELPLNTPEMDRPSNIPCIYSLWKDSNESCGTSEYIFEEKKPTSGYFSLLFGTFSKSEDAKTHIKKLKLNPFLKDRIIEIKEIQATTKKIQIESGDTLSRIAKRYSLKVKTIIDDNNIVNPNNIRIGQYLYIPGDPVKYRIITTNIKTRIKAQDICNNLLNLNFRCQILTQR
jgi:hypothetical protein